MRGSMLVCLLVVAFALPAAAADDPDNLPWSLENVLSRVPPLKNDAAGRLPMITWPPFVIDADDRTWADGAPLDDSAYRELARRGLAPHIPCFNEKYIEMAKAIQGAGCPVIMMEGAAGNGPGGDAEDALHRLPEDYKLQQGEIRFVCPLLEDGWKIRQGKIVQALQKYKAAGVTVDAIWLDWEVEPYAGKRQWAQSGVCPRCRRMFPKGVLDEFNLYATFVHQARARLFSTYVARPILDVFPACSTTNWTAVYSSVDRPTPSWCADRLTPPTDIGALTASNPVAYGNDALYRMHWKASWGWPLDGGHMDRLYTYVMLAQVSANAANQLRTAGGKQTVPWVCRYCPDDGDPNVPILSRPRYREILRHVWLRGATTMQIFNHPRPPRGTIAIEELQDAVAVYDEMLAHRAFLDGGQVMNTAGFEPTWDGAIWSGLRLADRALVRAFTMAERPVEFQLVPFQAAASEKVDLTAPPQGATYLLQRDSGRIVVRRLPSP